MKIIITESQNKSLKNNLNKIMDKVGIRGGINAVGGASNFIKIMFDGDYDEFIRQIVNDLIDNTELRGHHYYLFDCNISVYLNHRYPRPVFIFVPGCYFQILRDKYGLVNDLDELVNDLDDPNDDYLTKPIWEKYSKFVIDLYLKNK